MAPVISKEDWKAIRQRAPHAPGWFCRHFLGVDPWEQQIEIMKSVRDNPRTAVVACHAIGKSFITACIIIWFLLSHKDSYVVVTAPTWRQVAEVLWASVRNIFAKAPFDLGPPPLITPKWEVGPEWKCLGFSAREPERVQGFHSRYILVIIDEASGVPDKLFDGLRSLLASGYKVRLLLLSNPTRPQGELHRAFHGARHMYPGGLFQISCWDTPNFRKLKPLLHPDCNPACTPAERIKALREAPVERDYLISPTFAADVEEEFGWDSDVYRVRCLGQFPKAADGQLIPLHLVEDACLRWEALLYDKNGNAVAPWWDELHKVPHTKIIKASCDPARFGSNESTFGVRLEDVVADRVHAWTGLDSVALAGEVGSLMRRYNVRDLVGDDDGGYGAFLDPLRRANTGASIRGFRGGMAANNKERFANRRAESYFGLADRFREARIAIPRDDKMLGQLTCIRYDFRPDGRFIIESKADMVKRGLKSPDRADMLSMLFGAHYDDDGTSSSIELPTWATSDWSFLDG